MERPSLSDEPIHAYLREVFGVPALTTEEEAELAGHLLARDELAEASEARLAEAHLRTVVAIAVGYRNTGVHLLDLVSFGNEGLTEAVQTYADHPGISFSAHVTACVREAISRQN